MKEFALDYISSYRQDMGPASNVACLKSLIYSLLSSSSNLSDREGPIYPIPCLLSQSSLPNLQE